MDKCDDCKHGQWTAKGTPSDTYTAKEVLEMMYNFATHITRSYGLHSNQLTDKQGRPVVLTVTPGLLVEGWQASLEAEGGMVV